MDMTNVVFLNETVAEVELTARALEDAAVKYRNGELKLALCTFVSTGGDPSYIIRGKLDKPQECLLTMGMLDYQHNMTSNLMTRLMAKTQINEETEDSENSE